MRFAKATSSGFDTICSRAEVEGALQACQEANFLHCYSWEIAASPHMHGSLSVDSPQLFTKIAITQPSGRDIGSLLVSGAQGSHPAMSHMLTRSTVIFTGPSVSAQ